MDPESAEIWGLDELEVVCLVTGMRYFFSDVECWIWNVDGDDAIGSYLRHLPVKRLMKGIIL